MDSKTLTTVLLVLFCVLLFPIGIGLMGGIFGLIGSIMGGIFGLIGGLFGAIFGLIGGIFHAIFGVFGWMFNGHFQGHWPFGFFNRDLFTILVVILIIVLISRSKATRPGR